MSFDSFYGGRMGASFIIVKSFEDINIPVNTQFKWGYYAIDPDNKTDEDKDIFYVDNNGLIEKNGNNYTQYTWGIAIKDSRITYTTENISTADRGTYNFPNDEYAEGMVQCFSQGGASTNEVNYGEYVIIDTLDKNNPNNGKVFKRGMNYQYNETTNPLAGAKYIGQIVGPQGDSPELSMDHYDTIDDSSEHFVNKQKIDYTVNDNDIVPGYDGSVYNDKIELISANIKDDYGNIYACTIGFKLPYTVLNFNAEAVDPYYSQPLIQPNTNQYHDGQWDHPFYEEWDLKIPKGKHGTDAKDFKIIHTKTFPSGYGGKSSDYPGAAVFTDAACTTPLIVSGNPFYLASSVSVELDNNQSNYKIISGSYPGNYVKSEDCYMDELHYSEIDYNDSAEGILTDKNMGAFNTVLKVDIKKDGSGTTYYTSKEPDTFSVKSIQSARIDQGGSTNVEGTGDQKLHIGFSDSTEEVATDYPINYIIEMAFNWKTATRGDGVNILNHCLVYYADPALRKKLGGGDQTVELEVRPNWVTYKSQKFNKDLTQWVDLGPAVPAITKLTPLVNYESNQDPVTILGSTPPEQIKREGETKPINSYAYGWAVTRDDPSEEEPDRKLFYCFNYAENRWYSIGHAAGGGGGLADPTSVVVKSVPAFNSTLPDPADVENLQENGFWFAVESMFSGKDVVTTPQP